MARKSKKKKERAVRKVVAMDEKSLSMGSPILFSNGANKPNYLEGLPCDYRSLCSNKWPTKIEGEIVRLLITPLLKLCHVAATAVDENICIKSDMSFMLASHHNPITVSALDFHKIM